MNETKGRLSRGVLFGGNANNGAQAGLAYANTNNAPSNTNTNIGSRNCLKSPPEGRYIYVTAALPLGKKYRTQKGVGSGCVVCNGKGSGF